MERASNTWALLPTRYSSPRLTTSRRDATPCSPAPPVWSAQNWMQSPPGSCSLSSGLRRNHSSKLLTNANRSTALLHLRRLQRHHRIPALFPRFFHAKFRAIDQIRHNIFAVVLVLRHCFDNPRAQSNLRRVPRRPQTRSRAPQFVSKILRPSQRRVRQNKRQRPRRVFYRHIVLPNDRL